MRDTAGLQGGAQEGFTGVGTPQLALVLTGVGRRGEPLHPQRTQVDSGLRAVSRTIGEDSLLNFGNCM